MGDLVCPASACCESLQAMVRPEDVHAGDVVEKFLAMVRPAVREESAGDGSPSSASVEDVAMQPPATVLRASHGTPGSDAAMGVVSFVYSEAGLGEDGGGECDVSGRVGGSAS